ncbi:MAG: cell division protein ZapA [Pseudomonadota bacterium]
MPEVRISINNREHVVNCDPGQEFRVRNLAAYVDGRVNELSKAHGEIGYGRLMVLSCLLIADELDDAYAEIKRLRKSTQQDGAAAASGGGEDPETVEAIERIAARIEQLAAQLATP